MWSAVIPSRLWDRGMCLGLGAVRLLSVALVLGWGGMVGTAWAANEGDGLEIIDADVQHLTLDVEAIRREMGRPVIPPLSIEVTGASLGDLYFQAMTLLRRADQLAFEILGRPSSMPSPVLGPTVGAENVAEVLRLAQGATDAIEERFGIAEPGASAPKAMAITATTLLTQIMVANRQINGLLGEQFSSADVFQQVSLAIRYADRLLTDRTGSDILLDSPPYERGKIPRDVFIRLLGCYERLRAFADRIGKPALTLNWEENRLVAITPSDVYDMASLIVSELDRIDRGNGPNRPPLVSYYPGYKVPSEVFQRVGILERQMSALLQSVVVAPTAGRPGGQDP